MKENDFCLLDKNINKGVKQMFEDLMEIYLLNEGLYVICLQYYIK